MFIQFAHYVEYKCRSEYAYNLPNESYFEFTLENMQMYRYGAGIDLASRRGNSLPRNNVDAQARKD